MLHESDHYGCNVSSFLQYSKKGVNMINGKMTRKFLEEAFSGESQAHMKYLIFADVAEKEGYENIAKLYRGIAYAEFVHARNHFKALGNVSTTADNLQVALDGETFEVDEMYPIYKNTATLQGEKEAVRSTNYALEAEKVHADMYDQARGLVKSGKDMKLDKVFVCPVCGYTALEEVDPCCPVCGAPREKFVVFT
jgi:rubrerythrin